MSLDGDGGGGVGGVVIPNWLGELEAKRERRVKPKLGHETGAGAPCLTCEKKCPGLDLHFWRKICKNCKCAKDAHDYQDDDPTKFHFHLLGTTPPSTNQRIKYQRKLASERSCSTKPPLLPPADSPPPPPLPLPPSSSQPAATIQNYVLEWKPPGESDAIVDEYLNSLPVEELAVPGSKAAQNRRVLLQHQIPLHDIDPERCNTLSEHERILMRDYVAQMRADSVGLGHIVRTTHAPPSIGTSTANHQCVEQQIAQPLRNLHIAPVNGNGCRRCSVPFAAGEIAILAQRSAATYHTACFTCTACRVPLADLVYFYDTASDEVYCGRHFAAQRGIPRCYACDELIWLKEYCLANGEATYHVTHFCCFECDRPLAGESYLLDDGLGGGGSVVSGGGGGGVENPLCLPCYERLKAAKCCACKGVIGADEQGVQVKEGVHFHANDTCFACATCKRALFDQRLLLREGALFCSHECHKRMLAEK